MFSHNEKMGKSNYHVFFVPIAFENWLYCQHQQLGKLVQSMNGLSQGAECAL